MENPVVVSEFAVVAGQDNVDLAGKQLWSITGRAYGADDDSTEHHWVHCEQEAIDSFKLNACNLDSMEDFDAKYGEEGEEWGFITGTALVASVDAAGGTVKFHV